MPAKPRGGPPSDAQVRRLSPGGQSAYRHSRHAAAAGIVGGGVTHMVGSSALRRGRMGNVNALAEVLGERSGSRDLGRLASHAQKVRVGTALRRGGNVATAAGVGAAGIAAALGSRAKRKPVVKSAFEPVVKADHLSLVRQRKREADGSPFQPAIVRKGVAGLVDDATVAPARLRAPKPAQVVTGTPPGQAQPKPAKPPLGQRLNNTIAATGGPTS